MQVRANKRARSKGAAPREASGMTTGPIPVIDLFAGPGGLGEGFSSIKAGEKRCFELRLSIEKDKAAYQTLLLRAFFRRFPDGEVPIDYYRAIRGEIEIVELARLHPENWRLAQAEAWNQELGAVDLPGELLDSRIAGVLETAGDWVLIGGPPCQAYSIAGRSRNRGNRNYRPEDDHRHFLYREYLRIIARHWPTVFVMENVKGILTARIGDRSIFTQILEDLQDPSKATGLSSAISGQWQGYRIYSLVKRSDGFDIFGLPEHGLQDYVIESEIFGIPQNRHRVILLGIRSDVSVEPDVLTPYGRSVSAGEVLDGLPRLRSGLTATSDSNARWKQVLGEICRPSQMRPIRAIGGENVARRIADVVKNLKVPRKGRGGEFIAYDVRCAHEPEWYLDPNLGGVCNGTTRAHIDEDLHRYLYAACFAEIEKRSPKLVDFPSELRPDHRNVNRSLSHGNFNDRFRVQLRGVPSTTVVSHISKDGHYYIHYDPAQCRSLTVREVARLQTFPDNYFFCGYRTEQYTQVGNAVPPLLAKQIAEIVYRLIGEARQLSNDRYALA